MYNSEKKAEALDLWFGMAGTISLEDFVEELGYPSRSCLRGWIKDDPRYDPDKPTYKSKPILTKLEAIRRVADGEPVAKVGRGIGATNVFRRACSIAVFVPSHVPKPKSLSCARLRGFPPMLRCAKTAGGR